MNKKIFIFLALSLFLVFYKGGNLIPQANELNQMEFVRTVAIDKGKEQAMRISALIRKSQKQEGKGGEGGGGESESKVLTNEADSMVAAQKFFQSYSDKYLFYGHNDFILIGEDAAKENIRKYLDFVTRDPEYRLTSLIYITQGEAKDYLAASKTFLPDKLKSLYKSVKETSISEELQLFKMVSQLEENDKFALVIPTLKKIQIEALDKKEGAGGEEKEGGGEQTGENGQQGEAPAAQEEPRMEQEIALGGYAVIKDFKLIGFLNNAMAVAYSFVSNNVGSGVINVRDKEGEIVGLEIINGQSSIDAKVDGKTLESVTIKIKFETNVGEVHGSEDIFKEELIHNMERQQSEIVKRNVEQLVEFAKDNRADFLRIGETISLTHPFVWNNYKEDWPEHFSDLEINVIVESKISRSYDIRQPIGNKKK